MGIKSWFNNIGSAIKRGATKVKDWGVKTIGSAKNGIQKGIKWGAGALNTIGNGIKKGKQWLYDVPVLGGIAQGIATSTGVDKALNDASDIAGHGSNLLNRLGEGDFKGAIQSGGDAMKSAGLYNDRTANLLGQAENIRSRYEPAARNLYEGASTGNEQKTLDSGKNIYDIFKASGQ